jgi:hypothetical protein
MRKLKQFGRVFVGAVFVAFVALVPRVAASSTRSTSGDGCPSVSSGSFSKYTCSLATDSATYSVPALTGAYFDFVCPVSSATVTYTLTKYTYSGSVFFDQGTKACAGSVGPVDVFLTATASGVKASASTDDYLSATVDQTVQVYGVEMTFNP